MDDAPPTTYWAGPALVTSPTARLTAACRARGVFGARTAVVVDDHLPPHGRAGT